VTRADANPHADATLDTPLLPPGLRWTGPLLALGYGLGARAHRALSRPRLAPIATICVGNLTVGGTGKTPAVKFLARGLASRGRKPAVLMRGYKGQSSDEATEVRAALEKQKVPVLLGADRLAGAKDAVRQNCNVAILDDGFQHWRLARDLDIVLLDATQPFGGGRLLPHGRLRESPEGLSRAGIIIVTRSDCLGEGALAALRGEIKRYAPDSIMALARHKPVQIFTCGAAGSGRPPEELNGVPVLGVCGIGNPGAFRRTLEGLGARVAGFAAYADHHLFSSRDAAALQQQAEEINAAAIIVTEKDAAKLALLPGGNVPVWVLGVEFSLTDGEDLFWTRVKQAVAQGDTRVAQGGY